MDKKKKIIIVIAILLCIFGIFVAKKSADNKIKEEVAGNVDFYLVATEKIEEEELKKYNLPIIISLGSEGCMPCVKMKPTLRALNTQLKGKAIIKYVDVWKHPEYAEGYNFEYIPTQIFITKDGLPYIPRNVQNISFNYEKDANGNVTRTTHTGYLAEEDIIKILKEMGLE